MKKVTRWPAMALFLAGASAAVAQEPIQNLVLRNSFNPIGAGARGLGMGGAFIAVADDGTAASFNPAGLAQLRRTEFAVVGFHDTLKSTITSSGGLVTPGASASNTTKHGALDFVGLSVPFEVGGRNMTIQFSYQRAVDLFGEGTVALTDEYTAGEIFGSNVSGQVPGFGSILRSTPIFYNAQITRDDPIQQSGAFHTGSFSAGYQATDRLLLGVTINYWRASWTASGTAVFNAQMLQRAGPNPTFVQLQQATQEFEHRQSADALSFNAGFLLRYPKISIGGVLRQGWTGNYDLEETGRYQCSAIPALGSACDPDFAPTQQQLQQPLTTLPVVPGQEYEQYATTRLRWPRGAGAGIALRPFTGLTLAFDYSRTSWSRTAIEDLPDGALLTGPPTLDESYVGYTTRSFFDLAPVSQTSTVDTNQWRAGGEYLVSFSRLVIPLRGGYYRDQSPIGQVDGTRREIRGVTAGTGLNFSRIVLDVAFERRKSDGPVNLRLRGGESTDAPSPIQTVEEDRIVASVIYRFGGDDDPLKKLFKSIFVGSSTE